MSQINTTETKPDRPKISDDAIVRAAVKALAPKVHEWLDGFETCELSVVEEDLCKALPWYRDGYEIAKYLDRQCGYSPDAALVEILDDAFYLLRKAQGEAEKEWVTMTGATGPAIGSIVRVSDFKIKETGIVRANHADGKSSVHFPGMAQTSAFIIEWERLTLT